MLLAATKKQTETVHKCSHDDDDVLRYASSLERFTDEQYTGSRSRSEHSEWVQKTLNGYNNHKEMLESI